MTEIKFQLNAEALLAKLQAAPRKLHDLQKPFAEAGLYMERETKLNFLRQTSPDGKPWAQLKPSTLKRKKSGAILRETSALIGSIQFAGATNSGATVIAGTDYGIYHQFGTRKMVARPFMGISPAHEQQIEKIFEDYLSGLF